MSQITISINQELLNNPAIYCDVLEVAEDVELWVQKALVETPGALSPYVITTDYQDNKYRIIVNIDGQPISAFEGLQELISDEGDLSHYIGCNNYHGLLRLREWAGTHRHEQIATTVIIKKAVPLIMGISIRKILAKISEALRERQIITAINTSEYTRYYKLKIYNNPRIGSISINAIVTRLFPAYCSEWGSHTILVEDSRGLTLFNFIPENKYTNEYQLDPNETIATFLAPTDSQKKVGEQIHKIFSKSIIDKNKKTNYNNIDKKEETK